MQRSALGTGASQGLSMMVGSYANHPEDLDVPNATFSCSVVVDRRSIAQIAANLGTSRHTVNDARLAAGRQLLISDAARLDGVRVIGVDEHAWRHTRRGDTTGLNRWSQHRSLVGTLCMSGQQPRCARSSSNHALLLPVMTSCEISATTTERSVWPATRTSADGRRQEQPARCEQRGGQADHLSGRRMADQARDAGWTHENYRAAVPERELYARNASGAIPAR
jgi:hypothetical protein